MSGAVLAVIPARGGSKGFPRKNLAPLRGRPLIAHTILAAKQSNAVTRVIVSTDDEEIAATARQYGAEVPFLRSADLGGDGVHAAEVVEDAVRRSKDGTFDPEIVVMLLPTAPLRRAGHIAEAIALHDPDACDSVVSVCRSSRYLGQFRTIRHGCLVPLGKPSGCRDSQHDPSGRMLNTQRQGQDDLYYLNGAIYIAATDVFLAHGSFHLPRARPYVMSALNSIDIDTEDDLKLAECVFDLAES